MADLSRQIYQYMCDEVVGSEKVVKYRRLFFEVYEYVQNNFLLPSKYLVVSGSKAEGLDFFGSDLDIMLISKRFIVYESKSEIDNRIRAMNRQTLVIDTDNAQPGFVLLRVQNEPIWDHNCVERNEDGTYLSSKQYISNFATKYTDHKINGPCISNTDGKLDVAHSLKCTKWPSVAKDWTTRKRFSGWPSVFLVSDIAKYGVQLVPIGSKSCYVDVHPLEWRISFSIPEKKLINTWSHTQLLCYAILKILLKEVIKESKGLDTLLCSYFLKTTLFWLLEEVSATNWIPEKLLDCLDMCLSRLTYWITQKYIPNYFIPEHNMIDRQYGQQSWDELLALMSFLHGIGWQSIFLCDSFQLSTVFTYTENLPPSFYGFSDFEKAVIPFMHFLSLNYHFLDVTYGSMAEAFTRCLSYITKATLPNKYKTLFLIMLSSISFDLAESLMCKQQCNKQSYFENKQIMTCFLMCEQMCVVSGLAMQAFNLYLAGQYPSALLILEFAMSVCSCEQFIISWYNDIHISDFKKHNITLNKYASHLRKRKYYTRWDISLSNTYTFDYLLQDHPHRNKIFLGTAFFLYYLRFACCHRLQDIDAIQQSLLDLESFRDDMRAEPYIMHSYRITFDRYLEHMVSEIYTSEKRKLCTNSNNG